MENLGLSFAHIKGWKLESQGSSRLVRSRMSCDAETETKKNRGEEKKCEEDPPELRDRRSGLSTSLPRSEGAAPTYLKPASLVLLPPTPTLRR